MKIYIHSNKFNLNYIILSKYGSYLTFLNDYNRNNLYRLEFREHVGFRIL